MKNLTLILAILLFIAASALVGASMFAPKPLPQALVISPREKDFGTQRPSVISCTFDIINGLPYDVELVAVQKSCGCTTASTDKSILSKRGSARLTASVDLKGRAGQFGSNLTIVYKQAHVANARLQSTVCAVWVNVDPVVHVSSDKLTFEEGRASVKEIGVSFTDRSYKLIGVRSDHKAFDTRISQDREKIAIQFHPELWSDHNGTPTITIMTTCPFEDNIAVPLIVKKHTADLSTPASGLKERTAF